ncbi:hypothetical protein PTKIN_Ptkin10aG0182200 [Pterospermum kingtungense]
MALYKISLALALLSAFALPSLAQVNLQDPIINQILPTTGSPDTGSGSPGTGTVSPHTGSGGPNTNCHEYLDPLNAARAEVNVPPLTWDDKVAAFAQEYANKRKADCQLVHSQVPQYGECIAWGSGDMSVAVAAKMWIDEKAGFDPISNTCSGDQCGHYTQVVWKNTQRVGCAKVKCNNGDTFITCNFDPPGNVVGEKPF